MPLNNTSLCRCPNRRTPYTENVRNSLFPSRFGHSLLRRQDSNMRPPGYEPGELPTAPLRDINHKMSNSELLAIAVFLNCECKGKLFLRSMQMFCEFFFINRRILCGLLIYIINSTNNSHNLEFYISTIGCVCMPIEKLK